MGDNHFEQTVLAIQWIGKEQGQNVMWTLLCLLNFQINTKATQSAPSVKWQAAKYAIISINHVNY